MLSQKAYNKIRGKDCPACMVSAVEASDRPEYVGNGIIYHNCYCSNCGAVWTDQYTLIGYNNLQKGP